MIGQSTRYSAEGGVIVSHAPSRAHLLARILRAVANMTPLVLASLLTLALAWEMRAAPLTWFDGILSPPDRPDLYPSQWLTIGHAIVPVVFLLSNLVSRRFGEHFAIAHVIVSWTCAALIALAVIFRIDPSLATSGQLPTVRVAAAFLGAMSIGQLAGVYVFDRTRGVDWWSAPLYSALAASFIAMILFYVAGYAGGDGVWLNHMSVDLGVKAFMAFALLVPYFLLRPIVRPLGGLGGF
jgi:queuosine precursor transporter